MDFLFLAFTNCWLNIHCTRNCFAQTPRDELRAQRKCEASDKTKNAYNGYVDDDEDESSSSATETE